MKYPTGPINLFTSDTYEETRPSISCNSRLFIPTADLSALPSIACRLLNSLASLFATPLVCFQPLAASFSKMPGVGYPRQDLVHTVHALEFRSRVFSRSYELPPKTDRFASPAFSCTYKSLFSQLLEDTRD